MCMFKRPIIELSFSLSQFIQIKHLCRVHICASAYGKGKAAHELHATDSCTELTWTFFASTELAWLDRYTYLSETDVISRGELR